MCGIAGVLGELDGVDTAAMLGAIAHRGPDDEGELRVELAAGSLWMGHRRLSILDLSSAGHQPMVTQDRRLAIVFNGEIYNFKTLRDELGARGHRFHTGTDTEVVLAGYAEHGIDVLRRLKGMFAFALWDARAEELVLARDRLGEKPLYFHDDGRRFAFASEVRALLASGVVARELDPDGLDAYLTFGSVADPLTLVRNVRSLSPGEVAVVRRGAWSARSFWSLADVARRGESRDAVVEATHARLREATARCMIADVPVGVLLSGGVDSSSNVVLLAEQGFRNLQTFSIVFGAADAKLSEAPYSKLVAERFGTTHHAIEVSLEGARDRIPQAVASMDQPSHDGINTYLVSQAIAAVGIKVAITGQGADELFLGYWQRRRFARLLRAARVLPSSIKSSLRRPLSRLVLRSAGAEKLVQTVLGEDGAASAYLAEHSIFSGAQIERLRGRPRPSPTRFVYDPGGDEPLDRLSRLQLTNYLRGTLLRDADQMSMAHALELRAPFLDVDLVEQVVAAPPAWKLDSRRNKPLLLDAVGPALPREVWDRPKQGFGLPYDRWLREGLRVAEVDPNALGLAAPAVAEVRARFEQGQVSTRWWTLEVLAAWVAQHRLGARFL